MTKNKYLFFTFFLGSFLILSPTRNTAANPSFERPRHNRTPEEIQHYKESIVKVIEKNSGIIKEAGTLINQGKLENAIILLKDIIKHAPVDLRPYVILSTLYTSTGKIPEALKILELASDSDINFDQIFDEFIQNITEISQRPLYNAPKDAWITNFKENKKCAISYIFDDGLKSVYDLALPIFDQYGFKATINIVPGNIQGNRLAAPLKDWENAHQRGFEIGNHTMHHRQLRGLSTEKLDHEINESYKIITKTIGEPPLTFIFPFERHDLDQEAVKIILSKHTAIIDHVLLEPIYPRVFHPNFGGKYVSIETAKKMTEFAVKENLWLLPQCHGIKTEREDSYRPISQEFLSQHLSFIKERQDDIWIDTFINIYKYLYEKNNIKIEVIDRTDKIISLKVIHHMDPKIFNVPLTLGIDLMGEKPVQIFAKQNGKPLTVRTDNNLLLIEIEPVESIVTVEF